MEEPEPKNFEDVLDYTRSRDGSPLTPTKEPEPKNVEDMLDPANDSDWVKDEDEDPYDLSFSMHPITYKCLCIYV